MRKGLLLGIAGIAAAVGTANVRAACITTQDCAELGYKYTSSVCSGDRIACPFDTSKFFCFEPQICNYSYTAASCSSQCKSVGSTSCVKDGTTYYSSCGSSLCSSKQTCSNGTCVSPVATSGYCCGYCSIIDESWCWNKFGKNCYRTCIEYYNHPDCNDMQASCRASGGTPLFKWCNTGTAAGMFAYFTCP